MGIMDIRGDLEDMERTKRINQKTEKSKENRGTSRELGEIRRKWRDQKKKRNIDQGDFGKIKGKNAPIKK